MKIERARQLLRESVEDMTLEQLQRHRVNLIDALRESKAEYGYDRAVKNGFYKILESDSASGYWPSDMWLTHNLEYRLDEVMAKEKEIYTNEGMECPW